MTQIHPKSGRVLRTNQPQSEFRPSRELARQYDANRDAVLRDFDIISRHKKPLIVR